MMSRGLVPQFPLGASSGPTGTGVAANTSSFSACSRTWPRRPDEQRRRAFARRPAPRAPPRPVPAGEADARRGEFLAADDDPGNRQPVPRAAAAGTREGACGPMQRFSRRCGKSTRHRRMHTPVTAGVVSIEPDPVLDRATQLSGPRMATAAACIPDRPHPVSSRAVLLPGSVPMTGGAGSTPEPTLRRCQQGVNAAIRLSPISSLSTGGIGLPGG